MMLEQAYRFRPEGGYRITARSQGVSRADEKALEQFSDVMNPLFGQSGWHILSCLSKDDRVAVGYSTMTSDVHGRRTIFTNAVFMDAASYGECMYRTPYELLGIPLDAFAVADGASEDLPPFGSSGQVGPTLNEVRQALGLDDDRYAALLEQVLEALTSGGSLCLRGPADCGDSIGLVRDYVFCIARGLPRFLCGSLTYSSAYDCRASVCVVGPGRRIGSGQMFMFETDSMAPLASRDASPVLTACQKLVALSEDERHGVWEAAEELLGRMLPQTTRHGLGPVAVALWLALDVELDPHTALYLVRQMQSVMGALQADAAVVDAVLAQLMGVLNQARAPLGDMLPVLVKRAAMTQNAALSRETGVAQMHAAPGDKRLLLDTLLGQETATTTNEYIQALVMALYGPSDGKGPIMGGDNLAVKAFDWCLRTECLATLGFCRCYLEQLDVAGNIQFIAHATRLRAHDLPGAVSSDLLVRALDRAVDDAAGAREDLVDKGSLKILRSWYDRLEGELRDASAWYCARVCLDANPNETDAFAKLESYKESRCAFDCAVVQCVMEMSNGAIDSLWERFCAHELQGCGSLTDLFAACSCNVFMNPEGVFERTVADLAPRVMRLDYSWMVSDSGSLRNERDVLLRGIERVRLSEKTKERVAGSVVAQYWDRLTYRDVLWDPAVDDDAQKYPEPIIEGVPSKLRVRQAYKDAFVDPGNARELCAILAGERSYPDADRVNVVREIPDMLVRMLACGRFSWDLALVGYRSFDKKGNPVFDAEGVVGLLVRLSNATSSSLDPRWERPTVWNTRLFNEVVSYRKQFKKAAKGQMAWLVTALMDGIDSAGEVSAPREAVTHMRNVRPAGQPVGHCDIPDPWIEEDEKPSRFPWLRRM